MDSVGCIDHTRMTIRLYSEVLCRANSAWRGSGNFYSFALYRDCILCCILPSFPKPTSSLALGNKTGIKWCQNTTRVKVLLFWFLLYWNKSIFNYMIVEWFIKLEMGVKRKIRLHFCVVFSSIDLAIKSLCEQC